MNREETLAVLSVLRAAYPNFYKDKGKAELEGIVSLWVEMFADDPAQIVAAAVKAHIASDVKGFPPHIGAIKTAIVKLTKPPELEMSEMEAWALVRRAISGAYMEEWSRKERCGDLVSAEYNYRQLPPLLQQIVGNARQLAEWNKLPDDEIETITQSNFMRSFRARAASAKEFLALPQDVRSMIRQLGGGMTMPALTEATDEVGAG